MKKKLAKAQNGTVMGAEQGKKARILRGAGIASPIAGAIGMGIKKLKENKAKRQAEEYTRKKQQETLDKNKEGAAEFKTGGMVNSNKKVSALKSAGTKGVKSGVNTKVSAQKSAKGRVGGTSTAPKTATPKAKYGMSMRKK